MSASTLDAQGCGILTHREEMVFEQIRAYMARTRTAILAAPLAWVLLAWIQGKTAGLLPALLWAALVAIPSAAGLYFACRFEKALPRPEHFAFWRYRQHALQSLTGMAWGMAALLLVRPGDLVGELFVYLFLVGITATSISALSPFRTAVAVFTLSVWLPAMVVMAAADDALHWNLLALAAVLLGIENLFSWIANRQLVEGIEQTVSNRRLNDALLQTRNDLHRANADLEAKNAELTGLTRRLRELAMHDDLTGCHNRRYLIAQIEEEVALCARHGLCASLLMMDIDHFKHINDEHGHLAGDAVLREIAEMAQATLRDSDVFARFGGEEFVAILRMTAKEEAAIMAERLRQRITAHVFQVFAEPQPVSVSIGVADYQPGDSADSWLDRADSALYQAKAGGRNKVVAYAQMSLPMPSAAVIALARRRSSESDRPVAVSVTGAESAQ